MHADTTAPDPVAAAILEDRATPAAPVDAAPLPDLRADFGGSFAGWYRATFLALPVSDPPPAA